MRRPDARSDARPAGVDWPELHRRLEAARSALEGDARPAPAQERETLRARARALAGAEAAVEDRPGETLAVVEFRLAHETYGLPVAAVREVVSLRELTPLPGVPPFLLGIVNLRGRVVSVTDLKVFFELPRRGLAEMDKLVVVERGAFETGLLADAVLGVRAVAPRTLGKLPPTISDRRAGYASGVTPEGTIVLDADRILADPDLVVRQD